MNLDNYAALAERHMRLHLPIRYRQIEDPEAYFTGIGDQVAEQVMSLEVALAAQEPPASDYMARVGQLNSARMRAEEVVFADLIYLPVEESDEEEEIEGSEVRRYISHLPLLEEWEEDLFSDGIDPATGQALYSDEELMKAEPEQATASKASAPGAHQPSH